MNITAQDLAALDSVIDDLSEWVVFAGDKLTAQQRRLLAAINAKLSELFDSLE